VVSRLHEKNDPLPWGEADLRAFIGKFAVEDLHALYKRGAEGRKMDNRDEHGRFLAGAPSANPSGRPALDPALKARPQELTPRAIERLAQAVEGDDAKLAVQAANSIPDRALGRPAQAVDVRAEEVDVGQAHLAALIDAAKRRAAQRERERTEASANADTAGTALVLQRGR
jgi:hypothetical protein